MSSHNNIIHIICYLVQMQLFVFVNCTFLLIDAIWSLFISLKFDLFLLQNNYPNIDLIHAINDNFNLNVI